MPRSMSHGRCQRLIRTYRVFWQVVNMLDVQVLVQFEFAVVRETSGNFHGLFSRGALPSSTVPDTKELPAMSKVQSLRHFRQSSLLVTMRCSRSGYRVRLWVCKMVCHPVMLASTQRAAPGAASIPGTSGSSSGLAVAEI